MKNRQYLVVVRHSMDDVPIRLCNTEAEIKRAIRDVSKLHESALEVLGSDASTPIYIAVYEFVDGVFTSAKNVFEY